MDGQKSESSLQGKIETIYVRLNDVSKDDNDNRDAGGCSDITPYAKVSTDYVLKQLMKQNEMLMNLISLQANNSNNESKVIPILPDLNKSLPRFTGKSNNNDALYWLSTMCVDYRELNNITLKDKFSLPRIEDQIDMLKDKYYFTKLDLKNAFHHVQLQRESIKLT